VRTGTGRIDVAAGRDFQLGSVTLEDPEDPTLNRVFGAALYTAGRASALPVDFAAPKDGSNTLYGASTPTSAAFGQDGGSIRITAQRDVVGAPVLQQVNNWLFRQGRSSLNDQGQLAFESVGGKPLNTAWWARSDYFGAGVATLGGGNIAVEAASGSVRDLSASVATNAYVAGPLAGGTLREQGGGDLSVKAGTDILGGNFYVQKGRARIHADGSIAAGSVRALDLLAPSVVDADGNALDVFTALRPVLALGDASFDLSAGRRLEIEASYNPTLTRQNRNNISADPNLAIGLEPDSALLRNDIGGSAAQSYKSDYAQYSTFSTYGAQSAVRLTAVGSDLLLSNNALLIAMAGGDDLSQIDAVGQRFASFYKYAPPTVQAASLTGSLTSAQGFSMAPAAKGQLELMAHKSVNLGDGQMPFAGIFMLDFAPNSLSSVAAPALLTSAERSIMNGGGIGLALHTPGQLHAADSEPVRVVALTGDIRGQAGIDSALSAPKSAEILAGRDIQDLGFTLQHNSADAQTLVQAGRDIIDSTNRDHKSPVTHRVTGPGLLTLNAERDIDLAMARAW